MLELRPCCECCGANICTFECTFCDACTAKLAAVCPNCGGELLPRPRRPLAALARHPASTVRVVRPEPCFTP